MKIGLSCLTLATGLISAAACAQDVRPAASHSSTPAMTWSRLRFDLASLANDRRDAPSADGRAGGGVDVPVAARLVASVEANTDIRGMTNGGAGIAPIFRQESSVSGRLGVVVGAHGLVYGRLGYAELDTDYGLVGASAQRRSLTGVLVGVGSEVRLSSAFSFRSEYQLLDYTPSSPTSRIVNGLVIRF